jgi:tetratricopeptide (TPR) repeat protein
MRFSAIAPTPAAQRSAQRCAGAVELLRAGRDVEALAAFDEVLTKEPKHADALNDSAVALVRLGRMEDAIHRFERAAIAAPAFANAHHNLGMLLHQLGRDGEASAAFARSLHLDPSNATWWVDSGNAHIVNMKPAEALAAYDEALRIDPGYVTAMSNRAPALRALMRPADAAAACRATIACDPNNVDAWCNLGLILGEADHIAEGTEALMRALDLAPAHPIVTANLCALYLRAGRRSDALELAQTLVRDCPDRPEAWNALSHAQVELGAFDDMMASCERALALDPGNLNAVYNQASVELLRGDFVRGLEGYEARRRSTHQVTVPSRATGPEWSGTTLEGQTILVTAEQGAGDMFHFARYTALLKARGAGRVLLEANPPLTGLLATAPGVDAVVRTDEPLPAYDLFVPLLSLPRLFGTRIDSIPASVPYLTAGNRPVAQMIGADANPLKVGVVWAGNPNHQRDRSRSIALPALLSAVSGIGVALYSLQKDMHSALLAPWHETGIVDLSPHLATFDDTAAAVQNLDLVISVDTSVAHLAGALGRPVWVLLSFVPDWRWLLDRDDSPWYPTMRLFRQEALDEWDAPLAEVRRELEALARQQRALPPVGTEVALRRATRVPAATKVDVNATFRRASLLHGEGKFDAAFDAYEQVLAQQPGHPDALNNSAVLLVTRGDSMLAEQRVRAAIASHPKKAQAHSNLAKMLFTRGDIDSAIASFAQAVACEPQCAAWWRDYGDGLSMAGKHEEALQAFDRAVGLDPHNAAIIDAKAVALRMAARLDEAVAAGRQAVRLDPSNANAHANIALAFKAQHQSTEAEAALRAGLQAVPESSLLLSHLATLYREWGQIDASIVVAEQLIAAHPGFVDGPNAVGCGMLERGDLAAARTAFEHARGLDPASSHASFNLALLDLLHGDFGSGLPLFEHRRAIAVGGRSPVEVAGACWDGTPFNGQHVLIREEQGLGDLLQFVRYARELKAMGAGCVLVQCAAQAAALVATAPGVDTVVRRGDPLPAHDVYVPLMSLPYRCGTTIESIPATVPYLTAVDRPVAQVIGADPNLVKVGIVWAGNPNHTRDHARSIALPALLAAVHGIGASLYSLQKDVHPAVLAPWLVAGIVDLNPQLATLDDTAAAIMALDLVISVDTAVAHLAGALGKPVWILVSHVPDWRWLLDRDDSPWYPSVRLFRQATPGNWSVPLGQLRTALRSLLASSTASNSGGPRSTEVIQNG